MAHVPIVCPHYSCISRRPKQVEVSFKPKTRGAIQHLAIDTTGLKVYWKVKRHGTDRKRRGWRKLHLAVDTSTHEIVAAVMLPMQKSFLTCSRRIIEISGDGVYHTRDYHDAIRFKRAITLIPQEKGLPSGRMGTLGI
ncbi:transposase [Vibrio cholerae]|uniref:transposase n=1 Tax=Vibrio cholerae TaxID=666 RepID=UPI003B5162D5